MTGPDGSIYILKPAESYRIHLKVPEEVRSAELAWFNPLTGEQTAPTVVHAERFLAVRSPWDGLFSVLRVRYAH